MELRYELNLEHLRAFQRQEMRENPQMRAAVQRSAAMGAVAFLALMTPIALLGFSYDWQVSLAIGVLPAIPVYFLLRRVVVKRVVETAERALKERPGQGGSPLGSQILQLREEGLHHENRVGKSLWTWPAIESVERSPLFVRIRVTRNQAIVIPNEVPAAEFVAELERRRAEGKGKVMQPTGTTYVYDLAAADAYAAHHLRKNLKIVRRWRLAAAGLILMGTTYLLADMASPEYRWVLPVFVVLGYALFFVAGRWYTVHLYRQKARKGVGSTVVIDVRQDGMTVHRNGATGEYAWTSIHGIEQDKGYWFVYPNALTALTIPKKALSRTEAELLESRLRNPADAS